MKTTVEIADSLLEAARREAVRERTTVRALIEHVDPSVLDGHWTWTWRSDGLRFAGRRRNG